MGDSTGSAGLVYTSDGGTATRPATPVADGVEDSARTSDQRNGGTDRTERVKRQSRTWRQSAVNRSQINTLKPISNVDRRSRQTFCRRRTPLRDRLRPGDSNLSKYEILSQTGISGAGAGQQRRAGSPKLLQ